MDDILLVFIKDNLIVLGLALALLKAVAKATPWAVDDEIIQMLTGFIGRNKK